MPEFAPGEARTALAPITVSPAGLPCEAELFLGPNDATKVATSGRKAFTSTGAAQSVRLPVTMPATQGTYHIYIDVFSDGSRFLAYQATEDVTIAPLGVAEFIYASDIRQGMTEDKRYFTFEIDIKNTGGQAGECTITAHSTATTGAVYISYDNRTQLIQPGQTATFSGLIRNELYGQPGEYDWQTLDYISSEAGTISFIFGRSLHLVLFSIPTQVQSGNEYWATQVVHLPNRPDLDFMIRTYLAGVSNPDQCSQAEIGGSSYLYNQIVLDSERDYEITGIYEGARPGWLGGVTQRPAKAIWAEVIGDRLIGWHPIPPGVYTIYSSISWGYIRGADTIQGMYNLWMDVPVGPVEIV